MTKIFTTAEKRVTKSATTVEDIVAKSATIAKDIVAKCCDGGNKVKVSGELSKTGHFS